MRLSRRPAGALASALIAMSAVVVAAPNASAGVSCTGSASVNHQVNSAQTFVICTIIKMYPSGTPTASTPTFVNWKPPVCWLEPQYTGTDLQALIKSAIAAAPDPATQAYLQQMDQMYQAESTYHQADAGMWWGVGCRMDDLTVASAFPAQQFADGLSMNNPWVWIAAGTAPTQPNPVNGQILAQYAAAELTPPALTFAVNPGAVQTVNLSTRVFSNQPVGTYQDIEAQASIGGMTSIVDATPSEVTIYPNGPASQTVGGSPIQYIRCPIVNGSFGSPDNDSCSFFYTKATPQGASYQLTASITWMYAWVGHAGQGGFPVGVIVTGAPVNVTVQEVQAIVGGH
jgi:hypothetical protein